ERPLVGGEAAGRGLVGPHPELGLRGAVGLDTEQPGYRRRVSPGVGAYLVDQPVHPPCSFPFPSTAPSSSSLPEAAPVRLHCDPYLRGWCGPYPAPPPAPGAGATKLPIGLHGSPDPVQPRSEERRAG